MDRPEIVLVYDKECPVCDAYCRAMHAREPPGGLRLLNAREETVLMDEITRQGFDIDQGMAVKIGGRLHYGADAIHALATTSSASGMFGWINRSVFASKRRAKILYPVFRSARNLLLKLLRKTKINNLHLSDNGRF